MTTPETQQSYDRKPLFAVGDTVIVEWPLRGETVGTVSRVTKTQAVVGRINYNIFSGRMIGGSAWSRAYIRVPKEGEIEEVRKRVRISELCSKFSDRNTWSRVPLEVLEAVEALITEGK